MREKNHTTTTKPPEAQLPYMLDIKQAADFLGISTHHMYQLCCKRKVAYYKHKKSNMFLPEDLIAYVKSKRVQAGGVL